MSPKKPKVKPKCLVYWSGSHGLEHMAIVDKAAADREMSRSEFMVAAAVKEAGSTSGLSPRQQRALIAKFAAFVRDNAGDL